MSPRIHLGDTAMLVCGALIRPVREIVRQRGWEVDVYALPAVHHLDPDRLAHEVDLKLVELDGKYRKTVVVYGDCGTNGRLDAVLARHQAVRPCGLHCYEMLAGETFTRISHERPGSYFLTPWTVRNFRRAVLASLGLDAHPELIPAYFGNYTHVVYLRQHQDSDLDQSAAEIATLLGLQLEIEDTGLGELTRRLAAVVEPEQERSPLMELQQLTDAVIACNVPATIRAGVRAPSSLSERSNRWEG